MAPLTEIALFAGVGGGCLATRLLGCRVVAYVENDPRCVGVLRARIADGALDDAPIWGDVRSFDGHPWRGCVDLLTAGFPCEPFSQAGRGLAGDDPRNLWPEVARLLGEVGPELVWLENSPRLVTGSHGYFGQVLGDLAARGYDARWDCVPASTVGANHQRDRAWVLAWRSSDAIRSLLRDVPE